MRSFESNNRAGLGSGKRSKERWFPPVPDEMSLPAFMEEISCNVDAA
jgi:hypothetical protein